MENINIKYNRIYVAVVAIFLILSLTSNIYYYLGGKEIFTSNNSESNVSVVYANESNTIEQVNIEEIKIEEEKISKAEEEFNTKVSKIRKYLANRNSPLADYAEEFVKAADHYGIDYRLVAAISIIESGGGIKNFKPYNAWGWGTSGFSSYKEGIWAVSKGLSKYYAGGSTTPQTIAPRYCPPNATNWANKVSYVMNMISKQ
jgi:DNA-binding protein